MRSFLIAICVSVFLCACGESTNKPMEEEAAVITLEMVDTPVDPVCRMNMTGLKITDTLTYEGRTLPFCKASCKAHFVADPAAYLSQQEPEAAEQEQEASPTGS